MRFPNEVASRASCQRCRKAVPKDTDAYVWCTKKAVAHYGPLCDPCRDATQEQRLDAKTFDPKFLAKQREEGS
jgi:hypothetical protein